ncbi:uncharacterized protein [Heterodontus francisci]|uniref:uncharacterized protein n=1 Tax=Heterodontus francisci TaxID=7792 RepID=UPI00355C408C
MTRHRVNSDGFPLHHLRRIGRRASLPEIANLIDFSKRVTLIGRNGDVVDYLLSSARESRSRSISRMHARVIRSPQDNQHRLVDSSFSGVYVNDRRIDGDAILKEGDTVIFGHPQGLQVACGEKVRQPNSEFHFMFELCDCDQEQGSGLSQDPRPSFQVQTSTMVPVPCPRFPTPRLFLGAFPGFLPGLRWPTEEAEAVTRQAMTLHDSGVSAALLGAPRLTRDRPEFAPPQMMWLPYCQPSPEPTGSTGQAAGLGTSALAAPGETSHTLRPLPVTAAETSQVSTSADGSFPAADGSRVGRFCESRIAECRPFFPLLNSAAFGLPVSPSSDGYSNRLLLEGCTKGLVSAEAGCKEPPASNERCGSRACHWPFWDEQEARGFPGVTGGRTEVARAPVREHIPVPPSCFHRDSARRGGSCERAGGVCTVAHADSPVLTDEIAAVSGGSTGACSLSAHSTTARGGVHVKRVGNNRSSRRSEKDRSPSCGQPGVDDPMGMEWAPSVENETEADSEVPDVAKETVCAEPRQDSEDSGSFNKSAGERIVIEFTARDGTFTEEVPATSIVCTEGIDHTSEGSLSTVSSSCKDPAPADVQGAESQSHLPSEGSCLEQVKSTDLMKESNSLHPGAAQWLGCSSQSDVENKEKLQDVKNKIGTAGPSVETEARHDAMGDLSLVNEDLVENNSASEEDSNCVRTLQILGEPDDFPRDGGLTKDRCTNTATVHVENEENGDSHEEPLRLLVGSDCAEQVLPWGAVDANPRSVALGVPTSIGESMDDHLIEDVSCDHTRTEGAVGELWLAGEREMERVECPRADSLSTGHKKVFPAADERLSPGTESDVLSNQVVQELPPQCSPIGEATFVDTGLTTEHLNSSDCVLARDKLHPLDTSSTLGLRAETATSSTGTISNVVTDWVRKEGNLIAPEALSTDAESIVSHEREAPELPVGGLSASIKPAEDGVTLTEEWSRVAADTVSAECDMLDNSMPKVACFPHTAETKDGSKVTTKAAMNVYFIPTGAHPTAGHSVPGVAITNDKNPTCLNVEELCCPSLVAPGLTDHSAMQGAVSLASQHREGEQSYTMLGEATGACEDCETHGNTPEDSSEPGGVVSFMEVQDELNSTDQRELETDELTHEFPPRDDVKCDGKSDPLECTQFPSIPAGCAIRNVEPAGGLCVGGLAVNNVMVKEGHPCGAGSDVVGNSVILDPAVRDDAMEVGDHIGTDETIEVDPVSECADRNVFMASDLPSVSPPPSELELTHPLSDHVTTSTGPETCEGEEAMEKRPVLESFPVTSTPDNVMRDAEMEGFETLMQAGDPVSTVVKLEAVDNPGSHECGASHAAIEATVPSCIQVADGHWHMSLITVSPGNGGTPRPPMQTESLNHTVEEEPTEPSCCEYIVMNESPRGVPVSNSATSSSGNEENLQSGISAANSESSLEIILVTSDQEVLYPSRAETPPAQGAAAKPSTVPETGQDQLGLGCSLEEEGHLPSGNLRTNIISGAADLLSGPCDHFTTTGKMEPSGNSVGEEWGEFHSASDYVADGPGVASQMEKSKSETAELGGCELATIQHGTLSVPDTANFSISAVCGQRKAAEAGESPALAVRTLPLSCLSAGDHLQGSSNNLATLSCLERVHACENVVKIESDFSGSGNGADVCLADSTEERSGKEVLLSVSSHGDGDSSPYNHPLLDEAPAVAHFVTTVPAEQFVAKNNSLFYPEHKSVTEQSDRAQEVCPFLGTVFERELELSGASKQGPGWSDNRGSLGGTDVDQLEQGMTGIEEAEVTEIGLNDFRDKNSQFQLDRSGKVNPADALEGDLVDYGCAEPITSDSQRTEMQEDLVRGLSSAEEENVSEELMVRPGNAESPSLQCLSPMQSEDLAEEFNSTTGTEVSERLGSSLGAEQEVGEGSIEGDNARRWSVENSELTDWAEDEVCSDVCPVQTEIHRMCTQDPESPEEREVCVPVPSFTRPQLLQDLSLTAVVSSRQGSSDIGRVSQIALGAGEKSAPVSSEKEEVGLADERQGEMERTQTPEESAGPSELRAGGCPAGVCTEPLAASHNPDTRQHTLQCGGAMPRSDPEKPKALEAERRDSLQSEDLAEGFILGTELTEQLDSSQGTEISEGSSENDTFGDVAPCEPMGSNELINQTDEEELICTQAPDCPSNSEASTPEHKEELSVGTDESNLSISPFSPDCTVPGEIDFRLDPVVGNDGDLGQTSGPVTSNVRMRESARMMPQNTCALTVFPKEVYVCGGEPAEDPKLEDQCLEKSHDTNPAADKLGQSISFSKDAEVEPVGFVVELDADQREDTEAMPVTLSGEKGVSAPNESVNQTLSSVGNGVVMTQPYCVNLVPKQTDLKNTLEQRLEMQNQNEAMLRKCWPTKPVVELEMENVAISKFEQFHQDDNITQPNSLGKGRGSLLPEPSDLAAIAETHQQLCCKPEPESIDTGWQDVELDVMEKCRDGRSVDSAESETADIINTETGLEVGSTVVPSSPEDLNLQLSESESEREDIAGSNRFNSRRYLDSRALKRPREGDVALGSNSTAAGPNKRACTSWQTGAGAFVPAERLSLRVMSLSKELRQHRAWYVGRLVRQFFAELRASRECRVPSKIRVVNRWDEVAQVVREFFKTHVAQPQVEAIDTLQHNLENEGFSAVNHCHISENSEHEQEPKEIDELPSLEVSKGWEVQHKSPCFTDSAVVYRRGADGTALSSATEPTPPICRSPSVEVICPVGVIGDSETSLEKDGKLDAKMETVQENSWGDTSQVISSISSKSPHFDQTAHNNIPGDLVQMEAISATDGSDPSFSLPQGPGTCLKVDESPRACSVGPLSLPQPSSCTDSQQRLEIECVVWESQQVNESASGADRMEEPACDRGEDLQKADVALKSFSCALGECDVEAETDSRCSFSSGSADWATGDLTGIYSGVSSPSPALSVDASISDPVDLGGMEDLNAAEQSPADHHDLGRSHDDLGHSHDDLCRSHDEVEGFSATEPLPADHDDLGHSHDDLGHSHDEVEGFSAAESLPADHDDLGCSHDDLCRSHDEVEGFSAAEPSPADHDDLGHSHDDLCRSHDEVEGFSTAEPLPTDHADLGHSHDVVEGFSTAEPSPIDHDDLGHSHDVVEGFSTAEPSPTDHDDLGHSHDVVKGFSTAGPSPTDHDDLGHSHDDLGHSHDEVEGFSTAEPSPTDHDDLGRSHDEVEGFSTAEPSPTDHDDLGHSHDEVEGFSTAEPSPTDHDDLGRSHDEVEGFSTAEPSPTDHDDLGRSHDEVEGFSTAEPSPTDHDELGHSHDEVEGFSTAEPSPTDHDELGHSHDVVEGFSTAEPSPADHDNLGRSHNLPKANGVGSSAPPLGLAVEVQYVSGAGSFATLDPAPSSFAEPPPSSRGNCEWKPGVECSVGPSASPSPAWRDSSIVAGWSGCRLAVQPSDGRRLPGDSGRGCETGGLVESLPPGFPTSRSPGFEVEQPVRAAPRSVEARDLVQSESSSELMWREGQRVGGEITICETETEAKVKPHRELPEDSMTHGDGVNADGRLWTDFPRSGKEDKGKDRETVPLATNQTSSVGFAEDRIVEGGRAGANFNGNPVLVPTLSPVERKVPPHHSAAREAGPGAVEEAGACGWHSAPNWLTMVSLARQAPSTSRSPSLRTKRRRISKSVDGAGCAWPVAAVTPSRKGEGPGTSINCVIVISDSEDQPPLKTVKEESESDEETGSHPRGQGARGVGPPPPRYLPPSGTHGGGSVFSAHAAGISHPPGASCRGGVPSYLTRTPTDCPSFAPLPSLSVFSSPLPEASLDSDSTRLQEATDSGMSVPERRTVPSLCEERGDSFHNLRNAASPPIELLHPLNQRPNPSLCLGPDCVLPSQAQLQRSQDPPSLPKLQNTRLPDQLLLPYSFDDDDDVFPPPELDYLPDSPGNSDYEDSQHGSVSFWKQSANSAGSDSVFSGGQSPVDRGDGRGCSGLSLSQRNSNRCPSSDPSLQEVRNPMCLTAGGRSEGAGGGRLRSAFPERQDGKREGATDSSVVNAAPLCPFPGGHSDSSWATSDHDVTSQLRECELLLQCISQTLQAQGIEEAHVKEWKEKIEELQRETVPPLTHVAVIGDTGSGKSSLLNALLDEEAVLPTSAMRACTAVAVEVSHNVQSDSYQAEVEFFSEEEWDNELLSLLSDMTDKAGRLKRRRPDPNSEASVAYGRVKAVYGKILPYKELKQIRDVTSYLGKTENISETQARDFRCKVQSFIDSRTDDSRGCQGGEFWPIVKRVRIRVPRSAVLRTGAVLVDLPGVRDSNAARNCIAKEYLKNCDAVWIVANVTRAVDDKTAKDMLDESLRRQLLMDGQYGRIAFICTKTDSHNVTEILSALRLTSDCNPLEDEIAELRNAIEQRQTEQQTWRLELEHLRACSQVEAMNSRAKQLELAIKQLGLELTDLHHKMSVKRRDLSLNSIKARNFFCKRKIRLNFKCGLQELKRQAKTEELDSEEEGEESGDEDDDDDADEVCHLSTVGADRDSSRDGNLHVFTVSSTEYLKLRGKLLRDGPPQVFNNIEDTEIPAVQRFVHQITLARRALGTEVVIRNVARFVSQVVTYLTNRRAQAGKFEKLSLVIFRVTQEPGELQLYVHRFCSWQHRLRRIPESSKLTTQQKAIWPIEPVLAL